MNQLADHVVLITGGGSGLGLGVARHCRAQGAEVAIFEYDAAKVAALREEFGDAVLVVQGDVRSVNDLRACRSAIEQRWGRLTALIGAQGIYDGYVPVADLPLEKLDSLFDEVLSVNVKGYVLSAAVFIDMLKAERGAIVMTSSTAAFAADGGGAAYTASKGAVCSLVRQLSFEFAPEVTVNAVAPSGIASSQLHGPASLGMEGSKQSDIPADAFRAGFESSAPLQHLPTPEEYGPFYAMLASRDNVVMTGQILIADSGALNRALISAGNTPSGIG
ncbi:SDR family oxidoreductase [Mycolicibacterium sp. CBMA 226]|uniref:SDR family oxidoreductase n=1 Tax=Mycolicibacterium sp. CBMA 226 TaxID=2606611 RepID=UPI00130BB93E|nr:SDR family oxidoreductase [Mycolicibacterium sp. CBMA 226]MUL79003.1 SDR family oxidoreductase [Mycolicibacterium sp. CBMA 226]QGW61319.1 Cis-2,3-dihydrobiphenyl-2,3-diol dehydrogenase [Mycolicibacterium sp.]